MAETRQFRSGAIALALVAIGAIGGLYFLASKPDLQPTPPAPVPAPAPAPIAAAPAPPAPAPAAPAAAPPQFDVVRVDPSGNAVIAGRAAPGAQVTVKSGNTVIGTATADASGAFAIAPDNPLPAGAQQLTLSAALPGGKPVTAPSSAVVDVPAPAAPATAPPASSSPASTTPPATAPAAAPASTPLSVVTGPNGSKVLSGQGPAAGTLGLGTVDYDAAGHAIFSGTAKPGDHVALSLDNTKIGGAVAGPDGRWTLNAQVPKNDGTLSVTDGSLPPATAPFALETLPAALADGHVVIAPGQNLWLIARHVYGHGNMYTLIYNANQSQIRDPNLIFPGQAFSLPQPKG